MAEVIEFKPNFKLPTDIQDTVITEEDTSTPSNDVRNLLSTVVQNLKDIKNIVVLISATNGDKLMFHSNPTIEEQSTFLGILQYNLFQDITETTEDIEPDDEDEEDIN